jgi:hypothetical protein
VETESKKEQASAAGVGGPSWHDLEIVDLKFL